VRKGQKGGKAERQKANFLCVFASLREEIKGREETVEAERRNRKSPLGDLVAKRGRNENNPYICGPLEPL